MNLVYAVRRATKQDAPELARLLTVLGHPTESEAVAERWRKWEAAGNVALVAAQSDGSLAGVAALSQMVVLNRPKPVGRITTLVVDAPLQSKGIGRALVASAEKTLLDAGCGLLEITSNLRLEDVHGFYVHLGYKPTRIRFARNLSTAS